MNDCVKELIEADDLIVVAAMRGNAGAGGVFLALAADEVWMREGVVLNPHYKDMGNLYGSEYWTYLLPRRVGENRARSLAAARLPMGAAEAARLGLVDRVLAEEECEADRQLRQAAAEIAAAGDYPSRLKEKKARRARDEAQRPLAAYREAELENMRRNFWGSRSELPYRAPQLHSKDSEVANSRDARLASRAAEAHEVPRNRISRSEPIRRKLDLKNGRVDLSQSAGGRAMGQLIEDIFHAAFDNDWLRAGNDQSAFDVAAGRMVMTTDAYVGSADLLPQAATSARSAVERTINDIAMAGARPLYLSASFVIEEGLPLSRSQTRGGEHGRGGARRRDPIITGDTKVVERGKADKVLISTAGVGVAPPGLSLVALRLNGV